MSTSQIGHNSFLLPHLWLINLLQLFSESLEGPTDPAMSKSGAVTRGWQITTSVMANPDYDCLCSASISNCRCCCLRFNLRRLINTQTQRLSSHTCLTHKAEINKVWTCMCLLTFTSSDLMFYLCHRQLTNVLHPSHAVNRNP